MYIYIYISFHSSESVSNEEETFPKIHPELNIACPRLCFNETLWQNTNKVPTTDLSLLSWAFSPITIKQGVLGFLHSSAAVSVKSVFGSGPLLQATAGHRLIYAHYLALLFLRVERQGKKKLLFAGNYSTWRERNIAIMKGPNVVFVWLWKIKKGNNGLCSSDYL